MPYMVKENLCCFSTGYSKVRTEHSASFCVLNIGLNPKGSVPEVGMHPQGFPLSTLPARLPLSTKPSSHMGWEALSSCWRFRFKAWWEGIYPCADLSQGVLRQPKQPDLGWPGRWSQLWPGATQGANVSSQPMQPKFPELCRFVLFAGHFENPTVLTHDKYAVD